jgi:sulfite reductase beta subunit-like hemoprotein
VITGYNIVVGGSFGMSHGLIKTRPALAQPLGFVAKTEVIDVLQAIAAAQRDHGRRDDRKQARLKYVILTRGIDWFREQVELRLGHALAPVKPYRLETVEDMLGWHEQGDGRLFCGIWIPDGRIHDGGPNATDYRAALRAICERWRPVLRITPNANLQLGDLDPRNRTAFDEVLAAHRVVPAQRLTRARRMSHACVALPTCGLALAESERVFSRVMDAIDVVLRELELADEPLLVRMTGCPNGCARPYNADIAFVGRGPGKYALYVGGSHRGDRLVSLLEKSVAEQDLPRRVRLLLEDFVAHRESSEAFGDFWTRTKVAGAAPGPEQFHQELAQRPVRLRDESRGAEQEPVNIGRDA